MSTPKCTRTTVDGVEFVTREVWCLNSQPHRTDGPAFRVWNVIAGKAVLTTEAWYLNSQIHRIDGPAYRGWDVVDGRVVLVDEEWYLNGQYHRTDGPAWQRWRHWTDVFQGRHEVVLTRSLWYLQGKEIHPRILRQPVRAIERWWRFQQARRQKAIEEILWDNGMIVFPGLMGLIRQK